MRISVFFFPEERRGLTKGKCKESKEVQFQERGSLPSGDVGQELGGGLRLAWGGGRTAQRKDGVGVATLWLGG